MRIISRLRCRNLFMLCFLLYQDLGAAEFFIDKIETRGLQRVTYGRLLSVTQLEANQVVTDKDIAAAIKDIFATGFFNNVSVQRQDTTLIISVDERPSIEDIIIEGNKLIKTEQFLDALNLNGIKKGSILQLSRFNLILNELTALYAEQGRYGTKISTETETLNGNRIILTIIVQESKAAQVVQINIVGNEYFSDQQLEKLMSIKKRNKWNKASAKNQYSRQKLAADLDSLRQHYLNAGFARIEIKNNIVTINSAKDLIAINIDIDEGRRFTINNIRLVGDTIIPKEELREHLTIESGEVFNQAKIEASSNAIIERLGEEGYGLVETNSLYSYQDAQGQLDITFYVRPGQKTYVRRIQFVGNKKSIHTSLRRSILQMEGAPYSASNIRISLARLRRISYLEDARLDKVNVPGQPDQVDLLITVKEAPSGSVGGGLIYNDVTGLSLSLDYADRNFYGSGNSFSSSFSYSESQQALNFRYTQPFLTLDGLSASYFLRFRIQDFNEADIGNYAVQSSTAGFSFGYPVSLNSRLNYGLEVTNIGLTLGQNRSLEIDEYTDRYGKDYTDLSLFNSYSYNNLNRGFKPTSGNDMTLSWALGFPTERRPSYYKVGLNHKTYVDLSENIDELAMMFGVRINYFDIWAKDGFIPFYEHYFAGGVTTVRGYGGSSLGPTSSRSQGGKAVSSGSSLGGNFLTAFRTEFIFPIPGLSDDASGLRSSLFWDLGNVFNTNCIIKEPHCEIPIAYDQLRQSVGITLRWYIQFFPLSFVWSHPLNPAEEDRINRFQFTIGTFF